MTKKRSRAFAYRAGVRIQGTIVACDATAGSDLIFLSHARALDARTARALPRARAGKRQVLTTEITLALLGAAGQRLRPHALLAAYGRPFALGNLRLELLPSGHMPGAASLLCETDGRRVVYTGPLGPIGDWAPAGGDDTQESPAVRPADAVCLDATFGARRFSFPARAEALARLRASVREARAAGRAPLVLVEALGAALAAATALAADGVPLRAHRDVMRAAAAFREAGLATPALQRFDGRLHPGEALLWPPAGRHAPRLATLGPLAPILVSGWAGDPTAVALAGAEQGVILASGADFTGLLRYVEATGASEVALLHAPGDELAEALRARGIDAYALGPPHQISLFAGADAAPAGI